MARHLIGYGQSGRKALFGLQTNTQGQPLLLLEEGEVAHVVLDFADYLEGGESVSSAAVDNDAITVTASTSTPKVTLTASVAGSYGKTTVTVTLSTGDVVVEVIEIRQRRPANGAIPTDYPPA